MKKRLGFLIISRGWAGAENALHNIISQMIHKNCAVSLFLNEEIVKYYSDIPRLKIYNLGKMHRGGRILNLYDYYRASKKLVQSLSKSGIDAIMLFLEGAIILYSRIPKKVRVPMILSLRGSEIDLYNSEDLLKYIKMPYLIFPIIKLLKEADVIHSHSSWQISKILKKYQNKIKIINNGIDTNTFKSFKIKPKNNVILFAGRFTEIKGIQELVNVAKQLPQYEFWFAGQGPLSSLLNERNITNLGFKKTKELVELYNQATICVFPSWHEPFGNVGLEAMACGKAVIATPLGFSEYIENEKDGLIIPAKDEKELKYAIIRLMENPTLRRKLENNALKKAKQHSWVEVTDKYIKLFELALKEKALQRS